MNEVTLPEQEIEYDQFCYASKDIITHPAPKMQMLKRYDDGSVVLHFSSGSRLHILDFSRHAAEELRLDLNQLKEIRDERVRKVEEL